MHTDIGPLLRKRVLQTIPQNFTETALLVFQFQYRFNEVYKKYCDLLRINPEKIDSADKIPFLPVQLFKTQKIISGSFTEEIIFESSGTSGNVNARHFVKEKSLYEDSFLSSFRNFYGGEKQWCIIGLLPSYLERQHSSLVYMVQRLISLSCNADSGFYLNEYDKLKSLLLKNEKEKQPTLLIGVTYALIDFAEKNRLSLQHTTVMETGGMKGRRKELSRSAVHQILTCRLGVQKIHSEYGMTELLSQAYSKGDGIFNCPSQMRVVLRSEDDPLEIMSLGNMEKKWIAGAVNIIDLANLYSCSFIATDDAGKLYKDGSFEITGRLENSDLRGCGLMIS